LGQEILAVLPIASVALSLDVLAEELLRSDCDVIKAAICIRLGDCTVRTPILGIATDSRLMRVDLAATQAALRTLN